MGSRDLVVYSIALAETYLCTKFRLDPSDRLATIHQRYTQDRQRSDSLQVILKNAYFVQQSKMFCWLTATSSTV